MFRLNKQKIGYVLFLLLTTVITMLWLQKAAFLGDHYRAVSVRLPKDGVNRQDLEKAVNMEIERGSVNIPEITAWNQSEKVKIKSKELNRSAELIPVGVYGDMSLTAPMSLICGNFAYGDDRKGCVIDTKTAYQLFGTEMAVGNAVIYKNQIYYIRGVVKTEPSVLLFQGNESMKYSNLELLYEEAERGEEFAGDFLFQNGLSTEFTIIDGCFYSSSIRWLLSLPLWLFFFTAVSIIIRRYFRIKAEVGQKRFYLYGILGILSIMGFCLLLHQAAGSPLYIPEKLIPSQWSDFDYWVRQYSRIKEQVLQIRYLPPCTKDIVLVEELIKLPCRIGILTLLYLLTGVLGFEITKAQTHEL